MRSVNLLKIAAEAEWLRLRELMKRQALRGAYGAIAALFGFAVLTLAEVAAWQALRLKLAAIAATLILLGIDLVLAATFGYLATRSTPGARNKKHSMCGGRHSRRRAVHCPSPRWCRRPAIF